ncbi:MAG: phytanoyl-CoA dioxygenase family protein [Pseudomonadota bacterium]
MVQDKRTVEDYANIETAGKYKKSRSDAADQVDPELLEQHMASLEQLGYVVLQNVLDQQVLTEIKAAVEPLLDYKGRNFFEGRLTQRVYSLVAKTFACNQLLEHPMIVALLDSVMRPDYLLSQLQAINILPGEKQQPLHYDDSFYEIDRPRPPMGAATIWAIDDFTAENAATVLLPGSHKWGQKSPDETDLKQLRVCEMPAGSVVFFLGTLWHGGGANTSDRRRLAVTAQYCQGFCRPQDNFCLSVPPERVAQCSETVKRLLGYSVYGPFMGMVDGRHPKRLLEPYME